MADEQTEGTAGGSPTDATATPNTTPTQAPGQEAEEFNPERAQALIKKLREFEKEGKAAQKELAALKAKAIQEEQERLRAAGEYKTLAEAAEAKVKEFEPVVVERDRYRGVVESLLSVERKGLPKHITALLDKLDPADQLAWIAENRETIAKPAAPNVNARDGQMGKPPTDPKAREAEIRQRFRI